MNTSRMVILWPSSTIMSGFMKLVFLGIIGSTHVWTALFLSIFSVCFATWLCQAHLASWVTSHTWRKWCNVSFVWQGLRHLVSSNVLFLPLAILAFVIRTRSWMPSNCQVFCASDKCIHPHLYSPSLFRPQRLAAVLSTMSLLPLQ